MKFLDPEKGLTKRFCSVIGVGAAMAGSALIGAGGNIFSSLFGSSAAEEQAEAIRYAAERAQETALKLNERAREDVAPFREYGIKAGDSLSALLFGGEDVTDLLKKSPLFQFQSEIGSRDINRQLKARGLYGSGAGLETLSRFENQLVAQEGATMFDRLFNLTGLGANAAAGMAQNTTQTGNSLADLTLRAGVQEGAAIGEAGRSLASIGPGIAQPAQSMASNFVNYQLYKPVLDRLFGGDQEALGRGIVAGTQSNLSTFSGAPAF